MQKASADRFRTFVNNLKKQVLLLLKGRIIAFSKLEPIMFNTIMSSIIAHKALSMLTFESEQVFRSNTELNATNFYPRQMSYEISLIYFFNSTYFKINSLCCYLESYIKNTKLQQVNQQHTFKN